MTTPPDIEARVRAARPANPNADALRQRVLTSMHDTTADRTAATRPQRRRIAAFLLSPRRSMAVAALLMVVVLGGGMLHSPGGDPSNQLSSEMAQSGPAAPSESPAGRGPEPQNDSAATIAPDVGPAVPPAGAAKDGERLQQRTGYVRLVLAEGAIERAADRIIRAVDAMKGAVIDTQISTRAATLHVQVPAARVDEALRAFSKEGTVVDRSRAATDITAELAAAQNSQDELADDLAALTRDIKKASGLERDALRTRLQLLREQLTNAKQSERAVRERAAVAQITVALDQRSPDSTPAATFPSARWAADASVAVLSTAGTLTLTALIVTAPLAGLLALALLGRRTLRRRRDARLLDRT